MRPGIWTFSIAFVLLSYGCSARGADAPDLARTLLGMPLLEANWRQAHQMDLGELMAEDTPIDTLIAAWASDELCELRNGSPPFMPKDKVRQRLLAAVVERPWLLPELVYWLPQTPQAAEQVKAAYDKMLELPQIRDDERAEVRDWLTVHSLYFRDDLIAEASKVRYKEGSVENGEMLAALAELDWAAAEPIIREYAAGNDPHLAANALALRHARAARSGQPTAAAAFRNELQALVSNRQALPGVRAIALTELMSAPWDGRDTWFPALFSDPTIAKNESTIRALQTACWKEQDHWTPLLVPLLGGKDQTARDNTVTCLIYCGSPEAIRPLLPLLKDAAAAPGDRRMLLWHLAYVDVPEAVPAVIAVLTTTDAQEIVAASKVLTRLRPRGAGPALRKAFETQQSSLETHDPLGADALVTAMVACDALTDDEIAVAVETWARESAAQPEPIIGVHVPLPSRSAQAGLGGYLSFEPVDRDAAATKLLARAAALRENEPKAAERIEQTALGWPAAAGDRHLVARLRAGVDVATFVQCAKRRRFMCDHVAADLRQMAAAGGVAGTVAAGLLGDAEISGRILAAENRGAKELLLACARLARAPLPLAEVGRIMKSGDARLSPAAERYLEAEDSPAARALILAHHPGEVYIVGSMGDRNPKLPGGIYTDDEQRLRAELGKPNGPEEIFALLGHGAWSGREARIVRIRAGAAEFSIDDHELKAHRTLTKKELDGLRELVTIYHTDDLPSMDQLVFDGISYEYLHLTRAGGIRVSMNNPRSGQGAATVYDVLTRRFTIDLSRAAVPQAEAK
ncbi:MAG: HEAT repeat domain-containing protein [Tepidisphaerales bacterium]